MKYIKLFDIDSDRVSYEDNENYLEPYVSYVEGDNTVHYNKVETRVVVYYDIQDISAPTTIFTNYDKSVKSIEVDGKETISEFSQGDIKYKFDTVGEHVIKFEFNNPTVVGNNAPLFYNLTTVKRVVIPNTFTAIGTNAFNGCSSLTSVTIGSGITTIGDQSFASCSGLTEVTIPNSVTSIGNAAFEYCGSLTSIIIPNSVTNIGQGVFQSCTSLINITIGNGVTTIGNGAFQNCTSLTGIIIPNSVTNISDGVFYNCSSLTNIIIPDSVTNVGYSAFASCSSLANITSLATTAPTVGNNTFQNVHTNGTLTVPNGSSGYETWMNTSSYYLGHYNWTKVEQ